MKEIFLSACKANDVRLVRSLLARGANVNWRNDLDMRMAGLHYAARSNYGELLDVLLDQTGVDVNITNNFYRTPLIWACSRGHDAIVRRLSLVSDIEYNCRDLRGRSALHHAVYHNSYSCVLVLRDTGAIRIDWNIMSEYRECPLIIAVYQGYTDILQTILSVPQLDLGVLDYRNRNIAQIAVEELQEGSKCFELLIEDPRVNWNIKNRVGDTPLEYCIKQRKTRMAHIIIEMFARKEGVIDRSEEKSEFSESDEDSDRSVSPFLSYTAPHHIIDI